jgi:hypothetical protein
MMIAARWYTVSTSSQMPRKEAASRLFHSHLLRDAI